MPPEQTTSQHRIAREIEVATPYAPGTPDIFVRAHIVYVLELKQERRFRCGVCYDKS